MQVRVIPFEAERHLSIIARWFEKHSVSNDRLMELPSIGGMVFINDDPISAAFLRIIEGNFALLDGLITNPDESGDFRNEAIDQVVKYIFKKAEELKIKQILAHSTDRGTIERSLRHGFVIMPDVLIKKTLMEDY